MTDWRPGGRSPGDYSRRRIDQLIDGRFRRIERTVETIDEKVDKVDEKVDKLANRQAWLFGGLAVLTAVFSIIGPPIAAAIIKEVAG